MSRPAGAGGRFFTVRPLIVVALTTLALGSCDPKRPADTSVPPPLGHYEGTAEAPGHPAVRVALDIRHPSPGHYEAELTAPTAPALNFVADTAMFGQQRLLLQRPGGSSETLTLKLDGDFWRGTLALDSVQASVLLVKRGAPDPSTYRVEELPQSSGGSAWLFAPADVGTPGPALALLPDAATAPAAALWADALAREGIIVLLLPVADTAATNSLPMHLQLLRATAGADTANVGLWASGSGAGAAAHALAQPGGPRAAFFIAQNVLLNAESKLDFRALAQRHLPVLGLFGGRDATAPAALRAALGGRRGGQVLFWREAGPDLLVPGALGPGLVGAGPGAVTEWLQGK